MWQKNKRNELSNPGLDKIASKIIYISNFNKEIYKEKLKKIDPRDNKYNNILYIYMLCYFLNMHCNDYYILQMFF